MKYKAIIFDFDGVLIDTELYWKLLNDDYCLALGIKDHEEFYKDSLGLNTTDSAKLIIKKYNPNLLEEEVRRIQLKFSKKISHELSAIMPGVKELIKMLKVNECKLAIASSARMKKIEYLLDKFGLSEDFEIVLSTEGTGIKGKPDPEVYKKTIEKLDVKPEQAVIFEDSIVGLRSAQRSGAEVIAVPDERWSIGDFSSADLVAKTLKDPKIYEFLRISPLKIRGD